MSFNSNLPCMLVWFLFAWVRQLMQRFWVCLMQKRAGLVIMQIGKKRINPCSRYCVVIFLTFVMAQYFVSKPKLLQRIWRFGVVECEPPVLFYILVPFYVTVWTCKIVSVGWVTELGLILQTYATKPVIKRASLASQEEATALHVGHPWASDLASPCLLKKPDISKTKLYTLSLCG